MGGNNPRTEKEELKGVEGDSYRIKNRANSAYKIEYESIPNLDGVFTEDKDILINYMGMVQFKLFHRDVADNSIIKEETIEDRVGENIYLTASHFEGYKPLVPMLNFVVKENQEDVELLYEKEEPKQFTYIVRHIDKEDQRDIIDPETVAVAEGTAVTIQPIAMEGYILPDPLTSVIDVDQKELILEYIKKESE